MSKKHKITDPEVRKQVFEMTDGTCVYCGGTEGLCVDHIVPKRHGGPDHITNYVPACSACNGRKRDYHVLDFLKRFKVVYDVDSYGSQLPRAQVREYVEMLEVAEANRGPW